ncbi:hypothetical protein Droror1_Dr00018423 [Drosera rotundifolia]
MVAPTSYECGYFLNLHKATGQPILIYMTVGRFADVLEMLSDELAVNFVMLQLKKMLPSATQPIQYLVSRWGSDPDSLGCYSYDVIGKLEDVCIGWPGSLSNDQVLKKSSPSKWRNRKMMVSRGDDGGIVGDVGDGVVELMKDYGEREDEGKEAREVMVLASLV